MGGVRVVVSRPERPAARERQTRFPRSVYGDGEEPDYRFSLANERTFLSWLRTSIGLVAAGGAVAVFDGPDRSALSTGLAIILTVLGGLAALLAWPRWASVERAMRRGRPLPGAAITLLGISIAIAVISTVVLAVALR